MDHGSTLSNLYPSVTCKKGEWKICLREICDVFLGVEEVLDALDN